MKLDRKLNFGGKNRLEGNLVELRLWEEDGEVQGLMAPGKSMGSNLVRCPNCAANGKITCTFNSRSSCRAQVEHKHHDQKFEG